LKRVLIDGHYFNLGGIMSLYGALSSAHSPEHAQENPNNIPLSKKNSPLNAQAYGDVEFTGPLTWSAFKESNTYKGMSKGNYEDKKLLAQIEANHHAREAISVQVRGDVTSDSMIRAAGIADRELANERVLIESEKDANGSMSPKRVLVGSYEDGAPHSLTRAEEDIAALAIGSTLEVRKKMHVDAIVNLKNGMKTNMGQGHDSFRDSAGSFLQPWPLDGVTNNALAAVVSTPNGIIISLSQQGALLQPAADSLVKELHNLHDLDLAKPTLANNGQASALLINTGSLEGQKALVDLFTAPLTSAPANYTEADKRIVEIANILKQQKGIEASTDLDRQIDNGDFAKALIVTNTDAGTQKKTQVVLLGNYERLSYGASGEPDSGEKRKLVFTQSYNMETRKASSLEEEPITLQTAKNGEVSQEAIDGVVKKVQEKLKAHEISMLEPKGTNPHFDALLAKGPLAAEQKHEIGELAPATASVALPKKLSVA
jgi:hypothetical protein